MSTSSERMGMRPEEMESRAREQGKEMQYQARQRGEQLKGTVSGGLHNVAERLRSQAAERGQPGLASRVAEPIERSSQYLGSHSLSEIGSDARRTAQERPFWAVAGAFAAAFLVGRLLRRR